MKKYISIFAFSLSIVLFSSLKGMEPEDKPEDIPAKSSLTLENVYKGVWATAIAAESLAYLSKPAQYAIYGGGAISLASEKILRSIIDTLGLTQPSSIKQSHAMWPPLAGSLFANHTTLFISKEAYKQIDQQTQLNGINTILNNFDEPLKRNIISAAIMINNSYDTKLLAASIAVPIIVWSVIQGANALLQKAKDSTLSNTYIKKAAALAQQLKDSFVGKAGISLGILVGYILYQRSLMTSQVAALNIFFKD